MSLRVMEKGSMAAFVSNVMRRYEVVGPRAKDGQFVFGPITQPSQLRLDYETTILPPKKYLLPQREVLFTFDAETMSARPVFDEQPRVIFGAHTCDIHAMRLLDEVFATGQTDEH